MYGISVTLRRLIERKIMLIISRRWRIISTEDSHILLKASQIFKLNSVSLYHSALTKYNVKIVALCVLRQHRMSKTSWENCFKI